MVFCCGPRLVLFAALPRKSGSALIATMATALESVAQTTTAPKKARALKAQNTEIETWQSLKDNFKEYLPHEKNIKVGKNGKTIYDEVHDRIHLHHL